MISTPLRMENPVRRPMVPPIRPSWASVVTFASPLTTRHQKQDTGRTSFSHKQDFPTCNNPVLCATLFVLKSGMETERGGLSEATSSRGNFSLKCPFPLSSLGLIHPSFLPTFECSLSFRAHHHSTVAAVVKHFAFSGRRVVGHYLVFKGKRALRRRSASLLPMQCTLSSYLYGSNFGA